MPRRVWRWYVARSSTNKSVLSPRLPVEQPAHNPNGVERPAMRRKYRTSARSIPCPRSVSGSRSHTSKTSSRCGEATKRASRTLGRDKISWRRARRCSRSCASAFANELKSLRASDASSPSLHDCSSSNGSNGVRSAKKPAGTKSFTNSLLAEGQFLFEFQSTDDPSRFWARDTKFSPVRLCLRSQLESFARHRRSRRQDRPLARARERSDPISHFRSH